MALDLNGFKEGCDTCSWTTGLSKAVLMDREKIGGRSALLCHLELPEERQDITSKKGFQEAHGGWGKANSTLN